MRGALVIIIGSSGVGKSTLARALQEALLPEQWLHFSVDTLFDCLPPSVVERVNRHNEHQVVDAKALVSGAHACVRSLLERGHRVIFDAVVVSDAGAQRLLTAFGEFDPLVVELTCSWDVIRARTLARGDRTLDEAAQGFAAGGGHLRATHVFDTTDTPPGTLAERLVGLMRGSEPAR
ncbi:MAG: AAA family ATPase [Phycisphaerae bacterium]|nr:AAA family ATPase [Phycisphaerae bacterium]